MTGSVHRFSVAFLLSVAMTPPAFSSDDEGPATIPAAAYQRVNEALVEHHVLPRYQRLAEATAALEGAARALCEARDEAALEASRTAYHQSIDAWMGIEHIRFGPVDFLMRSYRLYFWPQGRGKVAAAIAELVDAGDRGALAPERFRDTSVAVQGLPAAEHLLFETGDTLMSGEGQGRLRCELLTAITANTHEMARGVSEDWREGNALWPQSFAKVLLAPGPENPSFLAPKDATLAFFNSLYGGLHLIVDVKLKPVLGRDLAAARPELAESQASAWATRNIASNLRALAALYLGEEGPGLSELVREHGRDPALDPLMRRAFTATLATVDAIDAPLHRAAVDSSLRPGAEKLLTQVTALEQIVRTRVAPALGLSVGFNALDGD